MALELIYNKMCKGRIGLFALTLLVFSMAVSALVSCGKPLKEGVGESEIVLILAPGSKDDKSYNSAIWVGCQRVIDEYALTIDVLEPTTRKEAEEAITVSLERGAKLIVVAPRGLHQKVGESAINHPKVNFVVFDSLLNLPNVASYNFDNYAAGVLGGVVVGNVLAKGEVGFIGADHTDFSRDIMRGFIDGLQYSNDELILRAEVLPGGFCACADEEAGKELGLEMFAGGCQVIFAPCGGASQGVLAAAAETGLVAVGADSNQNWVEVGYVLTSVVRALDRATYEALCGYLEGNFPGGPHECGLAGFWVNIVRDESNKDIITQDVAKQVDEVWHLMVNGEFDPQRRT